MMPLNLQDVKTYVENNIQTFHEKRIKNLDSLQLIKVLKRKNPYLFKAKNFQTAEEIVRALVEAHISSSEESIFGDWLEGLAIFINTKVYGGWKSGITGIDLEFDYKGTRNIVTIKSGPNWGNSSQLKKMESNFTTAQKTLRTSNSHMSIICINGCCYGTDNKPDKGTYFKYCGQRFWEFIGGTKSIYTDIIEPLGHNAKEQNVLYLESFSCMINKFTREFSNNFCDEKGAILWKRLVELNSQKDKN